MAAQGSIGERILTSATRRARKTNDTLALLRRMAGGDVVLKEDAVNAILRKAGLDEDLPFHWETLQLHLYDGYFELDAQTSALFINSPMFRIQGRFESMELSLERQIIRIRLLREVQTFAHGVVERLLLMVVRAIFGRLLEPELLIKLIDRSHVAFTQEEPNLLTIELHRMTPVRKQLDGLIAGAAAKILGRETVLVHAIDCRRGELIIRTTTVAQELSGKALKVGVIAGSAATQILGRLQQAGRAVAEEVREELGDLREELAGAARGELPEAARGELERDLGDADAGDDLAS